MTHKRYFSGGPEFEALVAAVCARHEGAVGAFVAELRRRKVPNTIRTAVLQPDHAQTERLDSLMIDLAGTFFLAEHTVGLSLA